MIIFDGYARAAEKEALLHQHVEALSQQGKKIGVAAIVFEEDAGSQLYTRLKKEAAERVGMSYKPYLFPLTSDVAAVQQTIAELNADLAITGIIIQKPTKRVWQSARGESGAEQVDRTEAYNKWWHLLTSSLAIGKDVDGLHPETLAAIENHTWQEQGRVLPATCQAVLEIMQSIPHFSEKEQKIKIIGKSDLLGIPLYYVLRNNGEDVELLTRQSLQERMTSGERLLDATVVISATGVERLITGESVSEGVAVIDVGEPKPDVDRASLEGKASFVTPVPGGVGPMTVVCLLENAVKLVSA